MFLYEFAEKTAQKPDTVATYVRRNKKIFKNHVERRQKQIWLDEKAVDILLKKYPEVQKKQKKPLNKERFEEIITKSLKTLYENQEILAKEIDEIRALVEELEESFDHKQAKQGMTGIWIARRYWLFFYIEEPIYPSVYHVFGGGARLFLTIFFFHC